jgi:hypothetical protein
MTTIKDKTRGTPTPAIASQARLPLRCISRRMHSPPSSHRRSGDVTALVLLLLRFRSYPRSHGIDLGTSLSIGATHGIIGVPAERDSLLAIPTSRSGSQSQTVNELRNRRSHTVRILDTHA